MQVGHNLGHLAILDSFFFFFFKLLPFRVLAKDVKKTFAGRLWSTTKSEKFQVQDLREEENPER